MENKMKEIYQQPQLQVLELEDVTELMAGSGDGRPPATDGGNAKEATFEDTQEPAQSYSVWED